MALLDWFRSPRKKQAVDFDSPAFLEQIMGNTDSRMSPEQAIQISAVYACVKVLSETVMTLPCELKKVDGDSRIALPNDPLYGLTARKPNDFMTGAELWAWVMKCLNLRGNAYLYKVRSGRRVVELLPLAPSSVTPRVIQPGNIVVYDLIVGDNKRTLVADEVVHFKSSVLDDDGVTGMSPITANSRMLVASDKANRWAAKLFDNSATPRGILKTPETLSEEAYANIKESWESAQMGIDNAHRTAILEQGLEFQKISMSPEDVQLLDSRQYSRSEIAGVFRVPGHMIGDMSASTYNNIEHQTLDFYKSSIAPWLRLIEQRLNVSLLGDSTREFTFDVRELIRGDMASEVAAMTALVDSQIITPNEARRALNWNPREGGDEIIAPAAPIMQDTGEESDDE